MSLLRTISPRLRRWRRLVAEGCGSRRYSYPALHGLDRKLIARLGRDGGFFVEAGANDGYLQSNTYALERFHGWRGILVEPIPELWRRCRVERPRATCVHAALVAADWAAPDIEMQFAGLMSMSGGAFGSAEERDTQLRYARELRLVAEPYRIRVPARTLSSILDEHAGGREVDLLSLDVEGAELSALAGLDLRRHAPRFICIEARDAAAVAGLLGGRYAPPEVLADTGHYRDLLFTRR